MKSVGITYRETCWIRNNIIIFVESSTTVFTTYKENLFGLITVSKKILMNVKACSTDSSVLHH